MSARRNLRRIKKVHSTDIMKMDVVLESMVLNDLIDVWCNKDINTCGKFHPHKANCMMHKDFCEHYSPLYARILLEK